jgi:hypothetical protein
LSSEARAPSMTRKDPRANSLGGVETLRCPVGPGSEEHSTDRRLKGRDGGLEGG